MIHPVKAHFHLQIFDQNIGFTGGKVVDPNKNYDLNTSSGVYEFYVAGGFEVKPGDTWKPEFLGIHAPLVKDDQGDVNTSFTIVELPLVAPEPASFTLLGIGSFGLLGYDWIRRKSPFA